MQSLSIARRASRKTEHHKSKRDYCSELLKLACWNVATLSISFWPDQLLSRHDHFPYSLVPRERFVLVLWAGSNRQTILHLRRLSDSTRLDGSTSNNRPLIPFIKFNNSHLAPLISRQLFAFAKSSLAIQLSCWLAKPALICNHLLPPALNFKVHDLCCISEI